ncbi:alpha-1,2 mannosyltransferase KTR1 [Arthroderma uncinatum]|uniref:alpha-1,2 mannosyltransferase KTR1 n=1 Tax=Arthroderma uncinatum TaxID=74035 RepID=UPI00144AC823|nr:alpha-1,2 mannosyltransferase KTR1 [Arthroderma uncinatum]KAF3484262.1 alpha-1,2 mannosyltransferase KTR1 [Arthroderma uncinatum]
MTRPLVSRRGRLALLLVAFWITVAFLASHGDVRQIFLQRWLRVRAHEPKAGESQVTNPEPDIQQTTLTGTLTHNMTPAVLQATDRVNATFVTLARNQDVWDLARTVKQIEDRLNSRMHYDWVFLNDKPFDSTFKRVMTSLVSGEAKFGSIPSEEWSFPPHIDLERAARTRQRMKDQGVIYGDSVSYRHMCRYQSGFFFRHPLMMQYEWYWRVEPGVEFMCDIREDPFRVMADKGKKCGFVISLREYPTTIPSLWEKTRKFIKEHPEHVVKENMIDFISDDHGVSYNNCHFWSNFEIGSLSFFRSKAYIDYFNHLDNTGGFFYERWGDAPIHSIAAALMLKKSEIHFFNDIGYYHVPFTHCPTGNKLKTDLRCYCSEKKNFDWKGYSCTEKFFDLTGLEKPEGYELESN